MNQHDTYLYNWLFHYNPIMDKHFAFHKDDFASYMNGFKTQHPVIKSNSHASLVSILRHFQGDPSKLTRHEQDHPTELLPM